MRLWALVTSALRMMKVSPCVGGCHVRGSPLLPSAPGTPSLRVLTAERRLGRRRSPSSACPYQGPRHRGQAGAVGVPLRALGTWGLPLHRLVNIARFLISARGWGSEQMRMVRRCPEPVDGMGLQPSVRWSSPLCKPGCARLLPLLSHRDSSIPARGPGQSSSGLQRHLSAASERVKGPSTMSKARSS